MSVSIDFDYFYTTGYIEEGFDKKLSKAMAMKWLKADKPLIEKDSAFSPLLENLLKAALESEMDTIHFKVMDDKNQPGYPDHL